MERPSCAAVTTESGRSALKMSACLALQSAEKASSSSRNMPARRELVSPSMYKCRNSWSVENGKVISSHDADCSRVMMSDVDGASDGTHRGVPRRAPTDNSWSSGKMRDTSAVVPRSAVGGQRRRLRRLIMTVAERRA